MKILDFIALTCATTMAQTEPDGGVSSRYFRYAAKNIPHITKVDKGGEDAWVASHNLLVVADGVGGWADQGVDAGLFSKQLCKDIKACSISILTTISNKS